MPDCAGRTLRSPGLHFPRARYRAGSSLPCRRDRVRACYTATHERPGTISHKTTERRLYRMYPYNKLGSAATIGKK
jgi:hypothetical protein